MACVRKLDQGLLHAEDINSENGENGFKARPVYSSYLWPPAVASKAIMA